MKKGLELVISYCFFPSHRAISKPSDRADFFQKGIPFSLKPRDRAYFRWNFIALQSFGRYSTPHTNVMHARSLADIAPLNVCRFESAACGIMNHVAVSVFAIFLAFSVFRNHFSGAL